MENNFLEQLAFFVSYPLAILVMIVIAVWVLVQKGNRINKILLIFLAGFFSWLVVQALKVFTQIPRPAIEAGGIVETTFSFPSGHSAVFFALATAMLIMNKKFAYFLFGFASLVAISRVVLNLHYVIDIVVGAIVGILIGTLFGWLYKKI